MQVDFTAATDKTYVEAVEAVKEAAAVHSFRVSFVHDLSGTLVERGFEHEPLSIVEICNAKFASELLEEEVLVSLMLPCRVVVYEQDGDVLISTMRPTLIGDFFPDAEIGDLTAKVEEKIIAIVEEAAAS